MAKERSTKTLATERRRRLSKKRPRKEPQPQEQEKGFRFQDPCWDDAFASYYDPGLRTCCRF